MNVAEAHAAIDALPKAEAIYQMLAHQLIEDVDSEVELAGFEEGLTLFWRNAAGSSAKVSITNTDESTVVAWRADRRRTEVCKVPPKNVSNLVDYVLHGWRSWEEYLAPSENAGASEG